MIDLQQIELIKRLKYKYLRALDKKDWAELAECFTEDAVTDYDSGTYSFKGQENIINFLKEFMDKPTIVSQHQVHHPEIDISSETTATGVWYLQDILIDLDANTALRGAGFYRDEYVKINGEWKIKLTGYVRTYEEIEQRTDNVTLTKNMFAKD
jgi:ketosteroid isomerase-like protein